MLRLGAARFELREGNPFLAYLMLANAQTSLALLYTRTKDQEFESVRKELGGVLADTEIYNILDKYGLQGTRRSPERSVQELEGKIEDAFEKLLKLYNKYCQATIGKFLE